MEEKMAEKKVTVRLNQQQWELVDNSVAEGVAASRDELFKAALREYGRAHLDSPDPAD